MTPKNRELLLDESMKIITGAEIEHEEFINQWIEVFGTLME